MTNIFGLILTRYSLVRKFITSQNSCSCEEDGKGKRAQKSIKKQKKLILRN